MGWGEQHRPALPPNASCVLAAASDLADSVRSFLRTRSTRNEEHVGQALARYDSLLARPY